MISFTVPPLATRATARVSQQGHQVLLGPLWHVVLGLLQGCGDVDTRPLGADQSDLTTWGYQC